MKKPNGQEIINFLNERWAGASCHCVGAKNGMRQKNF